MSNWLDRGTIPDVLPRRDEPGGGPLRDGGVIPGVGALGMTTPGQRPFVVQRGTQMSIPVTTTPRRLIEAAYNPVDSIIFDVYSSASVSVFWGWDSGVSVGSGTEIRPGLPYALKPENTREQWELQRLLEFIAQALGVTLTPYKAPRVVLDAAGIWVVSASAVSLSVNLINVPDMQ